MIALAENYDVAPPNSIDAEASVLASILMDRAAMDEVRGILVPDSFFQQDYKEIFVSMLAVDAAGKEITPLSLGEHLKSRDLFNEVGGAEALRKLCQEIYLSSRFIVHEAGIIAEKAKLRELISTCADVSRQCYAPTNSVEPAEAIARYLESAAARIREIGWSDSIRSLESITREVIESKESKAVERIATGLAELDELAGGIPISCMTLLAGRSGMGKSMLCKQIAKNAAAAGVTVGIVSIEEGSQKIGENYLSAFSGIENNKIVYNRLSAEDWNEVIGALPEISRHKIFIDDAQHTLSDIERTVRRMVRKYGCRLIIIDHLHLIDAEIDANRVQQVTVISGGLKKLIKELKVAGIVAAQMNRGGGAEHDAAPELWHLRDSGSLEQDGDLIIQLHRQDYYEWKKQGSTFVPDHRLRMYVNKNKSGSVGFRDAYFNGDTQTISNWNEPVPHLPFGD